MASACLDVSEYSHPKELSIIDIEVVVFLVEFTVLHKYVSINIFLNQLCSHKAQFHTSEISVLARKPI